MVFDHQFQRIDSMTSMLSPSQPAVGGPAGPATGWDVAGPPSADQAGEGALFKDQGVREPGVTAT